MYCIYIYIYTVHMIYVYMHTYVCVYIYIHIFIYVFSITVGRWPRPDCTMYYDAICYTIV